jgi:hypothetical protein
MLGTHTQLGTKLMHGHAHGPLPRLRTDAGTLYTADNSGFWCADIVTVKAGDREGLQNVKFDTLIFERVGRGHGISS